MSTLEALFTTLLTTARDIVPILSIVLFFQMAILRRPFSNPRQLIFGFACVLLGLTVFLIGLEVALFPLGEAMAHQLAAPEFLDAPATSLTEGNASQTRPWYAYYWVYAFAFTIGISTTIAEPALIAVANKASQVSGGTIKETELRLVVAFGVGIGVAVGTFRIIVGYPLPMFILPGYLLVIIQTAFAPKSIIPIAYDSGGVTTSTVTVPIVAALGARPRHPNRRGRPAHRRLRPDRIRIPFPDHVGNGLRSNLRVAKPPNHDDATPDPEGNQNHTLPTSLIHGGAKHAFQTDYRLGR